MTAVHVIGDVHGELDKLRTLLRDSGLVDKRDRWSGEDASLWFMGDLVDHGPGGIDVIALIMRLQEEARLAHGRVEVLTGNHDVLLLAAYRFGDETIPESGRTFREMWEQSNGVAADLQRLTPTHATWLSGCTAMTRVGDELLVHGDTLLYARYGRSIAEVNRALSRVLAGDNVAAWDRLLDDFEEHGVFARAADGIAHAEAFLDVFGGSRIVHGHTPISKITGQPPEAVREPLIYARDLCVDVDPGMYLGGAGFIYRLPTPSSIAAAPSKCRAE